jgi:cell division protein FtsI/penicillin-binding protein 2
MKKKKIFKKPGVPENLRLMIIAIIVLAVCGGIITRLFLIQVLKGGFYAALAQDQQQIFQDLIPQRGDIFIQDKFSNEDDLGAGLQAGSSQPGDSAAAGGASNYITVATSRVYQMLYLVPKEIPDDKREDAVKNISRILEKPEDEIRAKVDVKDDPYEPIAHKISDDQADQIKNLNIKGVYLSPETWRFYPAGSLLSQALGFVGFTDSGPEGAYGVEGFYNKELEGKPGLLEAARDAVGRWIFSGDYNMEPAQNGDSLVLTIDQNIQFMAEKELKSVVEKWQADSGTVIIMDPPTGKILAMASTPDYDPNNYSQATSSSVYLNPSVQEVYEPGSVFKPITMAAAINEGKVTPDTTYTDTGMLRIGGYTIQNAGNLGYGLSSMTKVLEKSINTGAVFAERSVGPDVFSDYVSKFGFGQKTGIDLGGETTGNTNNLKKGGPEINFATASFGQGISATPIEMISAMGAIANHGKLMQPYIVDKKIGADGAETVTQPVVRAQVVSPETASKVTSMLVSTVRVGYDKIHMDNYNVAGKTGTAQIADPKTGKYGENGFIHTFIGYAPAFDPKFIILFKLDRPKGINYASDSLSPTFADLAKYLLNYYEVPPEQ